MATDFLILPLAGFQKIEPINVVVAESTDSQTLLCELTVATATYLSCDILNIGEFDLISFGVFVKGTCGGPWQKLAFAPTDYSSAKGFRRVWTQDQTNDLTTLVSAGAGGFAIDVKDYYAVKLMAASLSGDTQLIVYAEVH